MTRFLRTTLCILCFCFGQNSYSRSHFTVSGDISNNNLGLNFQQKQNFSGSVAFDLGSFFRIGLTHKQSLDSQEGFRQKEIDKTFSYQKESVKNIANSLDFTLILYQGVLLVPYILFGAVKKDYFITKAEESIVISKQHYAMPIVPNAGIGTGIRLSDNFSLKLSYVVSPGVKQPTPDLKPYGALDSYTSVGISYDL